MALEVCDTRDFDGTLPRSRVVGQFAIVAASLPRQMAAQSRLCIKLIHDPDCRWPFPRDRKLKAIDTARCIGAAIPTDDPQNQTNGGRAAMVSAHFSRPNIFLLSFQQH